MIDAFEMDVGMQDGLLQTFKVPTPLPEHVQKRAIFVGSGDSLASAMLAEAFSGGKIRAMDPSDLYYNRSDIESKDVYCVSISGRTAAGIKASRTAAHSTAITATPDSMLARVSDNMILLGGDTCRVPTAGSVTFLESMLMCISLAQKVRMPRRPTLWTSAKADSARWRISQKIYVLGDLFTYPLAMYCAAKFHEILGYAASYARTEQFSHMDLFSVKRGDTVILFETGRRAIQLATGLKKIGVNVIHPDMPSTRLPQVIYCAFFSQFLALREAKRQNVFECHFITAEKHRRLSDQMIY